MKAMSWVLVLGGLLTFPLGLILIVPGVFLRSYIWYVETNNGEIVE